MTSALLLQPFSCQTMVAHLNLCLSHLSRSFARVQFMLPAFVQYLDLVGAPLTGPLLTLQVCEWQPPERLEQLLDLEMRDTGEPHHRLLELCQDIIRYSVKTSKNLPPWSVPPTSSYMFFSMYVPQGKAEYDSGYGWETWIETWWFWCSLNAPFNPYFRFVVKAKNEMIAILLVLVATCKYYLLLGTPPSSIYNQDPILWLLLIVSYIGPNWQMVLGL